MKGEAAMEMGLITITMTCPFSLMHSLCPFTVQATFKFSPFFSLNPLLSCATMDHGYYKNANRCQKQWLLQTANIIVTNHSFFLPCGLSSSSPTILLLLFPLSKLSNWSKLDKFNDFKLNSIYSS